MDGQTNDLDQAADEEILNNTVSDDALEAASSPEMRDRFSWFSFGPAPHTQCCGSGPAR